MTQVWAKRYNGPANLDDFPVAVAADSLGNVVVTGYSTNADLTTDYYTAKYAAADGTLLWEVRYNGPANANDEASSLALDSSGNVAVTGESAGDYYTAKYGAANGALLWEKRYNGPANGYDRPNSIAVDASGNVIVTGYSSSSNGTIRGYYTAKYAALDGALLWEKAVTPSAGSAEATIIAVDGAGNVIVAGKIPIQLRPPTYTYLIIKYAATDGTAVWSIVGPNLYPIAASFYPRDVAVDSSGNFAFIGAQSQTFGSNSFTLKYAAAGGSELWAQNYVGGGAAYSVAMDNAGNVVTAGSFQGLYINKCASGNGNLLWERNLAADTAYTVCLDAAGNAIVTGESAGDYYTAKCAAANGALLWEARYNGPANGIDGMIGGRRTLAITPDGGAVVTGYSSNGTNSDYATVRYAEFPAGDADGDGLRDSWEQWWWGTTVGHSALDDFDHDGIPELMEQAFALNPKQGDLTALPPRSIVNGYLTSVITKQPGVTYQVQTAGSPNAYAFSAATTTVLLDNTTTLKVRDNFLLATNPARYLRVKVTAAP